MWVFLIWLALCVVAWVIAENKGRSGIGFFLLSLLLSPFVGIIAALIVKSDDTVLQRQSIGIGQGIKCPYCAETIKAEAKVCRFCGNELNGSELKVKKDFDGAGSSAGTVSSHVLKEGGSLPRSNSGFRHKGDPKKGFLGIKTVWDLLLAIILVVILVVVMTIGDFSRFTGG